MKFAKLLSLLFAVVLLFSLTACKSSDGGISSDKGDSWFNDNEGDHEDDHDHSYSTATCTKPATCECGVTRGSALGHDYSNATCTTPQMCKRCGVVTSVALGHDFTEASCTSPEICKRCEETQGNPKGHNYVEATCIAPQTCTNCGNMQGSALGHTYADNTCIRCGEVDPDSKPVGLGDLYLMDSNCYTIHGTFIDAFGTQYSDGHGYAINGGGNGWSMHSLLKQYSSFSGTIVANTEMPYDAKVVIEIYVDDVLKYAISDYGKTSGAKDFSVDLQGGSVLKIVVTGSPWMGCIDIINAELTK